MGPATARGFGACLGSPACEGFAGRSAAQHLGRMRLVRPTLRQELQQAELPRLPMEDLLELIPKGDWITAKEAAFALGMDVDSFRAAYCDGEAPRLTIWQRFGPKGGRRVLIARREVEALVRDGLVQPILPCRNRNTA